MNLATAIDGRLRAHRRTAALMRRKGANAPGVSVLAEQLIHISIAGKNRIAARQAAMAIRAALMGARLGEPAAILRHIATDYLFGDWRKTGIAWIRFRAMPAPAAEETAPVTGEGDAAG